ncbi:hypothetical protein MKX03_009990 [Papaver bracteatum]|nr:hypothetical protein MKX03_009990 [Papaver bracteatum]
MAIPEFQLYNIKTKQKEIFIPEEPGKVGIYVGGLAAYGDLNEAFEFFYEGVSEFGPFWDHVLGYWKESLENPQKVLFLKYEDLKKEPKIQVKTLAKFMGYSFSVDEETHGVIEDIISLCSFEHLKNLEVNKNGYWRNHIEKKVFFRKGEVGDSKNYLTPLMVERLDRLMEEKLLGSGLVFQD